MQLAARAREMMPSEKAPMVAILLTKILEMEKYQKEAYLNVVGNEGKGNDASREGAHVGRAIDSKLANRTKSEGSVPGCGWRWGE